jgi:hypothetical protein
MNISLKKITSLLAVSLLALTGFGVVSGPALAGTPKTVCDYEVKDQTDNDHPLATIRLVSPVLNEDNSIHRDDFEEEFTILCDWFGVGTHFNQVYVPFGLTTNLTYRATYPNGQPMAFTQIKLRANKGYSQSNALIEVNGRTIKDTTSAFDGGSVKAMTDSEGYVTFVVKSPTNCEEAGGVLPPAPKKLTDETPHDKSGSALEDCYSQLIPQIVSETVVHTEKTDTVDFVELHYFDSSALAYSAKDVRLSMSVPAVDETNSVATGGVTQVYAPIGSQQTLVVQATNKDNSWARNVPVTVRINLANSGANGKVKAGVYTDDYRGFSSPTYAVNSLSTVLADPTKTAEDQLVLTGTTDAFGTVVFALNNIDTTGEIQPASLTTAVPAMNNVFSRITAEVVGGSVNNPLLEMHYFKPLATSASVTAKARKITVTIKNALNKSAAVSVTGIKKPTVTAPLTVATKTLTFTVKKGKITVKVVVNGKTTSKVFTIK